MDAAGLGRYKQGNNIMDNSIKLLFDEHEVITLAIGKAHEARSLVGKDNEAYEWIISELIRFFRQYADHYHHYKEEQILFPELAKKSDLLASGIITEMFSNHEDFREQLGLIEADLHAGDFAEAADKMDAYTEALQDHIAVENDELFLAAADLFSEDELDRIYFRFVDLDSELGEHKKKDLTDLLAELGS